MAALYRLYIALFMVLLTACAGEPTYYHSLADNQIPKQDKKGTVFLHVVRADMASPLLRENSLALIPVNTGKTKAEVIVIDALDDGGVSSSSFLAALPPATYTILSLGNHSKYSQMDSTLKQPIGNFTVRAGSFVNLGTLIMGKDRIMRSAAEVPPPMLWQRRFPNLYQLLINAKPVQWDTPNSNTFNWEQLVDRFANTNNNVFEMDNHQSAWRGPLGVVRVRDAEGRWQEISLHNTAGVLTYARSNSGVEFVALEYQQFYLRNSGASTWREVAAPEEQGGIRYATFAKNRQLYLAMIESNGTVKIYSTALNTTSWQLAGTIAIDSAVDVVSMLPGNGDKRRDPYVEITAGADGTIDIRQVSYGTLGPKTQLTRFDCMRNIALPLIPAR